MPYPTNGIQEENGPSSTYLLIEEVISHLDFTNNNMDYYTLVVCTKPERIF